MRHLLIVIAALSHSALSLACECLWQGDFSTVARQADVVVGGQIIATKGNALDLHISARLRGQVFDEVIRIWANPGNQCRPEAAQFPVDSHWVLALFRIDQVPDGGFNPRTPNISYGREGDFYLSKCGAYWLALHDGYISGNLVDGGRWQWELPEMNPVLLALLQGYLDDVLPRAALVEAAKPQTEAKKMLDRTRAFIRSQQQ